MDHDSYVGQLHVLRGRVREAHTIRVNFYLLLGGTNYKKIFTEQGRDYVP